MSVFAAATDGIYNGQWMAAILIFLLLLSILSYRRRGR